MENKLLYYTTGGYIIFAEETLMENCPHCKKDPRSQELIENLQKRLNRISGQINGVSKMINENRYCGDVLIQIAAVESALKEVGYMILEDHLKSCVYEDMQNNNTTSLEEALEICKKLN